jgi:hypothetical protein
MVVWTSIFFTLYSPLQDLFYNGIFTGQRERCVGAPDSGLPDLAPPHCLEDFSYKIIIKRNRSRDATRIIFLGAGVWSPGSGST